MKEVDDTPVPESETEAPDWFLMWLATYFSERLNSIELRIANLEARKPPQDTNPDPEWYA